jgi:hypothetical protein
MQNLASSGEAVIREPRKRRAFGRLENLHPGRGQQGPRTVEQPELRLENFRDVPRLFGRNPQVRRVTVDRPPVRSQASIAIRVARVL